MTSLGLCRVLLRNIRPNSFTHGLNPLLSPPVIPRCYCPGSYLKMTSFLSTSADRRNKKESVNTEEENLDKPIKFTTSGAAQTTAEMNLSGDAFPDAPWYQPWVVIFSVASFLLYFLYLREENDIDEEMKKPLWERIPGLEKKQLQIVWEYNAANNIDNTDIENRMRELAEQDRKLKESNSKSVVLKAKPLST